jgi:hypothetical protein
MSSLHPTSATPGVYIHTYIAAQSRLSEVHTAHHNITILCPRDVIDRPLRQLRIATLGANTARPRIHTPRSCCCSPPLRCQTTTAWTAMPQHQPNRSRSRRQRHCRRRPTQSPTRPLTHGHRLPRAKCRLHPILTARASRRTCAASPKARLARLGIPAWVSKHYRSC